MAVGQEAGESMEVRRRGDRVKEAEGDVNVRGGGGGGGEGEGRVRCKLKCMKAASSSFVKNITR